MSSWFSLNDDDWDYDEPEEKQLDQKEFIKALYYRFLCGDQSEFSFSTTELKMLYGFCINENIKIELAEKIKERALFRILNNKSIAAREVFGLILFVKNVIKYAKVKYL